MPNPKDVYILIEEIELEVEKGFSLGIYQKALIKVVKHYADNGKRLTDPLWESLVELYLESEGRTITQ